MEGVTVGERRKEGGGRVLPRGLWYQGVLQ